MIATAPLIQTADPAPAQRRPKLIFLVTEDWYFWSHRLPVARAAREAGFAVSVATRVREHGERIRAEGFRLWPLPWRRRGDGAVGACRAILAIAQLYRRERPDIVHHVALKPVLFGGLARLLAFARRGERPACIAAVTGLGSGPSSALSRRLLAAAVRLLAGGRIIVQNPEDGMALAGHGEAGRIALIRGSGVDLEYFEPLAEPPDTPLKVALVARMLRSKGVLDAAAATRLLRGRGLPIELMLVGPTDPDNRDSLDTRELAALAAEPGISWLGRVDDVRSVWRRAAIAVLPSTYGEGVPKALLEAAACARPIIATDTPGCRDVVQPGETGLLVPPHDVAALADALAALAGNRARRNTFGLAGRALVEREFGDATVASQTLALYRMALDERSRAR